MNRLDLIQCFLRPGRKGLEFILKITNVILSCKTASLRLSESIFLGRLSRRDKFRVFIYLEELSRRDAETQSNDGDKFHTN